MNHDPEIIGDLVRLSAGDADIAALKLGLEGTRAEMMRAGLSAAFRFVVHNGLVTVADRESWPVLLEGTEMWSDD